MENTKKICLLDLNYTLVRNQAASRMLRPFSARMNAEEYRLDLIEKIKDDYVIIITARPTYQAAQTMANIEKKTGWQPAEYYFNDTESEPPVFKRSALQRFIFPKHGNAGAIYYAVESNPKTRTMYSEYGIFATPYELFLKTASPEKPKRQEQPSLF
jgi:hypothetical protein